jgi:acyl carrier protein
LDTRENLQDVFREVFGDDELVITDSMTSDDVDGWDSLKHINLILAIEKRFRIKFATAEIAKLAEDGQTVGSLLTLVQKKLG